MGWGKVVAESLPGIGLQLQQSPGHLWVIEEPVVEREVVTQVEEITDADTLQCLPRGP